MPGMIIKALPKTTYDFSTLTGANQTMVLTVARGIDVSAFREATALMRVHSINFNQSPSVKIDIFPEAPTSEDPSQDFIATTAVASSGTVALNSFTAPYLNIQPFSTPFGAFLRIKVTGTQGATASTTFNFAISIDIVAKS
jgi:hypothetical protein